MKSDSEKEAGALLLKQYGNFFKRQHEELSCFTNGDQQENKCFQIIHVQMQPKEMVPLVDLLASDNTVITKVLSVLSSLCVEVNELKTEAYEKHFMFLAVYDLNTENDLTCQIKEICNLNAFAIRCCEVLRNMCCQAFALYTEPVIKMNGVQLHYIINHIGEIFTLIVLLELLINTTSLTQNWNVYCKELSKLSEMGNANITEQRWKSIKDATHNITLKLMSDNLVQNSLSSLSSLKNKLVDKNSNTLTNEMSHYIKTAVGNLDKLIQENPSRANMFKCIKVNCLFVLHTQLFGINDKKMFKSLMDLNTKAHSIPVVGITMWYPEQFLQRYVPSLFATQSKVSQLMLKSRQSYLTSKKASLARDVMQLQSLCTEWIINVDVHLSHINKLNATDMNYHVKLLLKGLDLTSQINFSVVTLINLHLSLGVPLSKSMLMAIFEAVDVLKGMKNVVNRNVCNIVTSLNMVVQHLLFQASSTIVNVKKNLMTDKNYANQRLDELTCLVIAEKALNGAPTLKRIVAANVALSFLPDSDYVEDTYERIAVLLEKVRALTGFIDNFKDLCNCSWLLWHQNVLPIYLDQNFSVQLDSLRLKNFLDATDDCALLLQKTNTDIGVDKGPEFLGKLQVLMYDNVLMNASQQIETNLRLHIHSHLHLDVTNPFTTDMIKRTLFNIDNVRLYNMYMSVVPSVEHYLSTMYYNLATVVLSDWRTYADMRQMAKFKFNLTTVDDNLPTQTLEQGLDVLEIMRNIHIFVSKYLYNLNNQIFIEKSSNNKHLNSINIQHIANSIRTHGTGIMNTTVNFTYQFLKKKFFTFSQFLYDEHIKSRLMKDRKMFKENNMSFNNMYPYKNAEKFNKGIRNLGLSEGGQTYLDLFRDLISQIGNAMGYVRMIRSGGRHCCADATVFLPSIHSAKSFKTLCEESHLDETCLHSAEILDQNIDSVICNFMQGTEYFKLLVDVFAPIFRNPKNVHLQNFFVIVPPLTLNFIEHMILCKDKMTKKNKAGAAFTDDGFAMGVAYILKLLDQDSSFESLHWFESVWEHIEQERKSLNEQKNKGSTQLQLALALTDKKLKTLEQEFQLLYYSLTSARIFFR